MQESNRWWKLLRPEVVILIIVPTTTLMLVASLGMLNHPALGRKFWTSLIYMRFFAWEIFHLIFFVGLGYLVFSAIAYGIQRMRFRLSTSGKTSPTAQRFVERFQMAKSFVWLVVAYAYGLIANVIAMNALCFPDPKRVAWANEFLMRADRMIFGTFVPFEMHEQDLYAGLSTALLFCYIKLSLVLSLVLIALFIFRADRFRQYVLAFVAIMFLCMPGWAALPATTPGEAFRTGKLQMQVPVDIDHEIADPVIHLNYKVTNFLNRLEPYESDPANGRYFITSFPSLHVAWGILVVWYGVQLYSRSAILLLPWALLNIVGAIYSLQHYAVDALAGIVVAIIAVYLVRGLVALEAKHGLEAPKGYGLSKFIQRDVVALGQAVFPSNKRKVERAKA